MDNSLHHILFATYAFFVVNPDPSQSSLIKRCASEVDRNAGESPARRVRLFTTEHDLNSVAARRGWKLRKMSRRAVMKMNHI